MNVVSNALMEKPYVVRKNSILQDNLQVAENIQDPVEGLPDNLEEDSAIKGGKYEGKEDNCVSLLTGENNAPKDLSTREGIVSRQNKKYLWKIVSRK